MSGTGALRDGVKSTQVFSERKLLRLKIPVRRVGNLFQKADVNWSVQSEV